MCFTTFYVPLRAHETFSPTFFILPQFSYSNLLPITIMFPIFILALNAISQCSLLVDTGCSYFNEIKVMIASFNPLNFCIAL